MSCLTAPTSAPDNLWERSWGLDWVDEADVVRFVATGVEWSVGVAVLLIDRSVGAEIEKDYDKLWYYILFQLNEKLKIW